VLERPVSKEEVRAWLQDRDSPMLFVERAIKRARPLMVHTVTQQSFLKKRYGAEAHILTFCPTEIFDREELTEGAKNTLREKYGISSDTFLIASFGRVGPTSGMGSSIMAVDLLRSWGIPAELYFAGNAEPYDDEIRRICGMYAVTPYVHCGKLLADETAFRDFLIASDAGIHLEAYEYGKPSTVLTNCISAGLPVLANRAAANTCDSPAFMFALPDRYSPLHIAEQLALIWEARSDRAAREEERAAFLQTHNFAYYAKRLSEILGIS
jgi:glycosyltransferase involved in cell wall biosynthesis